MQLRRLNRLTPATPGILTAALLTLARLLRLNRLTVGRQLTLQASRLTAAILGIVATLLQISQLTVETPTLEIVVRQHLVNLRTVAILGTQIVALVQLLQVNQLTAAILGMLTVALVQLHQANRQASHLNLRIVVLPTLGIVETLALAQLLLHNLLTAALLTLGAPAMLEQVNQCNLKSQLVAILETLIVALGQLLQVSQLNL